MLTDGEERYIEEILEAGQSLEQDTFEFMIEEGVPADAFVSPVTDYNIGEILDSLEEKDLAYTEEVEETVHYNGGLRGEEIEPIKWENTGFKSVDRQYIYFTEELEDLYRE